MYVPYFSRRRSQVTAVLCPTFALTDRVLTSHFSHDRSPVGARRDG